MLFRKVCFEQSEERELCRAAVKIGDLKCGCVLLLLFFFFLAIPIQLEEKNL